MRRHLFFKATGTTLWTWAFFVGYFHLLRHVTYPVTIMPLTPLDAAMPAVPAAIVPYLSLWIYVGIAPGLQRTFRELLAYGLWAGLLCTTGLAIFYRWPTRIPPLLFASSGFPGFDLLAGIDAAGNACPSMHVAIALFSAIWSDVLLRECRTPAALRAVSWTWFAAITFSTMAIRQHVLVDVVAGALLGVAFAVPSLAWRPARASPTKAADGTAMIGGGRGAPQAEASSADEAIAAADDDGSGRPGRETPDTMGIAR